MNNQVKPGIIEEGCRTQSKKKRVVSLFIYLVENRGEYLTLGSLAKEFKVVERVITRELRYLEELGAIERKRKRILKHKPGQEKRFRATACCNIIYDINPAFALIYCPILFK